MPKVPAILKKVKLQTSLATQQCPKFQLYHIRLDSIAIYRTV